MPLATETIAVSVSTSESLVLSPDVHYDLTVAADVSLTVSEADAILFEEGAEANDVTVTIDGTVTVESASDSQPYNTIAAMYQNAVTMQIGEGRQLQNAGVLGTAILARAQHFSLANAGLISGHTAICAEDVSDFVIENTGVISSTGQTGIEITPRASPGATGRLDNSGLILGQSYGVALDFRGVASLEIENSGRIRAEEDGGQSAPTALWVGGWAERATLINSGTIEAVSDSGNTYAVDMSGTSDGTNRLYLNNSGLINGDVLLEFSQDVLVNSGTITGWICLYDGDDRYVATGLGRALEGVLAGDGADTLRGGRAVDTLIGEQGEDVLSGGNGDDLLDGGDDNDSLTGGQGDDLLVAGSGADVLRGGAGWDHLGGDAGDDILYAGAGIDTVQAGSGNDVLYGGADADVLEGHDGDDTVFGGTGADVLEDGSGTDVLRGGAGADTLSSSDGVDILTGGSDADQFEFWRSSVASEGAVVTDFENGTDQLYFAMRNHDVTEFNFEDIVPYARQVGDHVVMDLSELGFGRVVLRNMELADLDASDFRINSDPL